MYGKALGSTPSTAEAKKITNERDGKMAQVKEITNSYCAIS